jgi:hypothetical protein
MRILCDSLEEPFLWFPLSYEAGFHDLPPPYTFLYLIRSCESRSPLLLISYNWVEKLGLEKSVCLWVTVWAAYPIYLI